MEQHRGLKGGTEREDLVGFLTELFTSWVRDECETVISISLANRVGPFRRAA